METTYPKGPEPKNTDLVALPASYRLKAIVPLLAILIFFMAYAALVVASLWLVKEAVLFPIYIINYITIVAKISAIGGSVLLFVFTLKFIFKLFTKNQEEKIAITPQEEPEFFRFLNLLASDVGVSPPKRVYLEHGINAFVRYRYPLLSIFFPVKKDLHVGVGLIHCMNLSEFKAILAHELGHFSQSSMKVGSYVYSANIIIHDMLYVRDGFDRWLDSVKNSETAWSFGAYILDGIIHGIRWVLSLFHQLITLSHASLSKAMEYNADKTAVMVSGSAPIVSGLKSLIEGEKELNLVFDAAYKATGKDIYCEDLYDAFGNMFQNKKQSIEDLFDLSSGERKETIFKDTEEGMITMYASHPKNHLREQSAFDPFISAPIDTSMSLKLFKNLNDHCHIFTQKIYQQNSNYTQNNYSSVAIFLDFLKQEERITHFVKTRHLVYRDFEVATDKVQVPNDVHQVYEKALERSKELRDQVLKLEKQKEDVELMANGVKKAVSINFRGDTYDKNSYQTLHQRIGEELDKRIKEEGPHIDHLWSQATVWVMREKENTQKLQTLLHMAQVCAQLNQEILELSNAISNQYHKIFGREQVIISDVENLRTQFNDHSKQIKEKIDNLSFDAFEPSIHYKTPQEIQSAYNPDKRQLFIESKTLEEGIDLNRFFDLLMFLQNGANVLMSLKVTFLSQLEQEIAFDEGQLPASSN